MKRKSLSIMLVLVLIFTYIPMSVSAFSEEPDPAEDIIMTAHSASAADGQTITINNYHSNKRSYYHVDTFNHDYGAKTQKSTFYAKVPKKGAVILTLTNTGNVKEGYFGVNGVDASIRDRRTDKDDQTRTTQYTYNVEKAGTIKLDLTQYMMDAGTGSTDFNIVYIPVEAKTYKAKSSWTSFTHGTTGDPTTSTSFKVKIPSKGYLILDISDPTGENSIFHYKTIGMNYESLGAPVTTRYIGVKKGTYTFNVKTNAAYYDTKIRFVKVKEGAYGTSKGKAKKLKKNSARKGLVVVNGKVSQKTHWYKFKLGSNANTEVTIRSLISGGGNYGGLKISIYGKNGLITDDVIHSEDGDRTYKLQTSGLYGKLKKGTYWIKVKNESKGNGYFTVKWS